ncbi:hypothetical protein GQ42DRAFT_158000 [Ramicandelaber brevisporus]|nr:hypothetical protein GQ42DRAFT_158000 [Ramicandelaber brevisporus]
MYWRMSNIGAIRRSTLESLLDRASYTLEELLADADILSEFRTSNARLLNVLCERQNIARMILYVFGADPSDHASVAPPTLEDSSGNPITEEQYANFVYVSGEILSADTWVMADALMEHTELLSDVWKLLDRPAPITDHNKMCVFYNMTLALIQRKRPEMLQFLKSQPRTVDRIMTHLHSQYITDLVVKFVTLEDEPTVVLSGGAKFVGEFHHEDSAMFYTWNGQPVVAPDLLQSSSDNSNNANASKEHTVLSAEQVIDWFSYYGLMRRLIERMDPNIYMSKRSERLVQRSNTATTTGNNNGDGDGSGDGDEITPVDVPTAKRPSVNSINGIVASSKDGDAGDNEEDDDEDSMQHKPSSGRDSSPDSDVSPTDLNATESVETSSEDANTPRKVRRMRQPSSPGTMAAAKLKQSASSPPEDQPLAVPPPNASVAEQSVVESDTPVVNKKSTESISVQDVEIEVDIDAISQTSQRIVQSI